MPIAGLYALIDPQHCRGRTAADICAQALEGGAAVIQLRDKRGAAHAADAARQMRALCQRYEALFILNDYPELARQVGAHGVHLGQTDMPLTAARKLLAPNQIIGTSNSTLEQARQSEQDGAAYLAVGSIFPTATKNGATVVGTQTLAAVKQHCKQPVVAIGGITPHNAAQPLQAGADALCVGSAISAAHNPRAAATAFSNLLQNRN